MILPNKYLTIEYSLVGVGAIIIHKLTKPKTISTLWEEIRKEPYVNTYHRFIVTLDFLFLMGFLDIKDGLLYKKSDDQ